MCRAPEYGPAVSVEGNIALKVLIMDVFAYADFIQQKHGASETS